jgi:membrane protease YdiL (CAAX protease family)
MSAPPKPPAPAASVAATTPKPKPPLGEEPTHALLWDMLRKRPNPFVSVAFTVPVFLVYHLGILAVDRRHDVDFISTTVLRLLNASTPAYVLVTLAMALVLLVLAWLQQRKSKAMPHAFKRVLAESLSAALLVLMSIGWATHEVRTGETLSVPTYSLPTKIVLAAGAGFHEEFIFRALLITGMSWAFTKLTKSKPWVSLLICTLISSVLFSLAHYFVLADEELVMTVAGFRVLEGVMFAVLYISRGFAVAVYAHALYDLMAFYLYS